MKLYKVVFRSFSILSVEFGRPMNKWFSLDIIKVFKAVIFPIGVS